MCASVESACCTVAAPGRSNREIALPSSRKKKGDEAGGEMAAPFRPAKKLGRDDQLLSVGVDVSALSSNKVALRHKAPRGTGSARDTGLEPPETDETADTSRASDAMQDTDAARQISTDSTLDDTPQQPAAPPPEEGSPAVEGGEGGTQREEGGDVDEGENSADSRKPAPMLAIRYRLRSSSSPALGKKKPKASRSGILSRSVIGEVPEPPTREFGSRSGLDHLTTSGFRSVPAAPLDGGAGDEDPDAIFAQIKALGALPDTGAKTAYDLRTEELRAAAAASSSPVSKKPNFSNGDDPVQVYRQAYGIPQDNLDPTRPRLFNRGPVLAEEFKKWKK